MEAAGRLGDSLVAQVRPVVDCLERFRRLVFV